jgi:L-fuconate dehydratase
LEHGYPAYTTSVGWYGFSDETIRKLCREALDEGWTHFKLKVGGDPADDLRRARLVREEIGPSNKLMVDANQKWDVGEAIQRTRELAGVNPWWMEEPTSPDDILGHARIRREVAPIRIATGEHCQNRIIFKQLMQAAAIDVCQIDS